MALRLATGMHRAPPKKLTAADVMALNPKSIRCSATARKAAEFLSANAIHTAPVVDEAGRPIGVVSETDLLEYWGCRRDHDSTFGHPYALNRSGEDFIVCMYCAQREWDKRAYLEGIANQLRNEYSVRVSPRLLDHRDVALALREAVSSDVDLVVMAAHGKGLIRRWVSGSTVHELIRGLPVPLLIVGADGSFAAPVPDRVRRILIALDGSPGAEQSIGPAMALGDIAHTEYLLLRVVPLSSVFGALSHRSGSGELPGAPKRVVLSAARRYLRRVASRMEQQSCIVDSRVVLGRKSISRSIAAKAAAYNADVIAIATRKDGEMRWLGSIADRLVQFASMPVLVAAASVGRA